MTGAELPTTIVGLIGLAIVTLGGIIHLRIQQQTTSRQVRDAAGKINEVHEQTVNDHRNKSNMRDDLDTTRDATGEIYNVVRDMQDRQIAQDALVHDMRERQMAQGRELGGMRADMTGVRADMTGVRTDLTAVNERLNDERNRSINADEQLWRAILNRPPAAE